eukprot:12798079-Heterocapsa_arctica.AAC.1
MGADTAAAAERMTLPLEVRCSCGSSARGEDDEPLRHDVDGHVEVPRGRSMPSGRLLLAFISMSSPSNFCYGFSLFKMLRIVKQ